MDQSESHNFDKKLRALLNPDPDTIYRVESKALAPSAKSLIWKQPIPKKLLAGVFVLLCVILVVIFNNPQHESSGLIQFGKVGELTLIYSKTGGALILDNKSAGERLPVGSGIIMVEREDK